MSTMMDYPQQTGYIPGADDVDERANYVAKCWDDSVNSSFMFRRRLPRYYDLCRGILTQRYHTHKNNKHVPLIFATIQAACAAKLGISFGSWPFVTFEGYDEDDLPIARKWDSLFAAQARAAQIMAKAYDFIQGAELNGTAVGMLGWDYRCHDGVWSQAATLPLSKRRVEMLVERRRRSGNPIVDFDGPQFENIDLLDFGQQPGKARLEDMRRITRHYFLDLDECEDLAQKGPNGERPIFDPAIVAQIRREGSNASEASQALKQLRGAGFFWVDNAGWRSSSFNKVVEIIEFWGYMPYDLTLDGYPKRVITVANRKYVLRDKPYPYWHLESPFISHSPTRDPYYFFAPGKAEILEKVQIGDDELLNAVLDTLNLVTDPFHIVSRDAQVDPRGLYMRPGRIVQVSGNPQEKWMVGRHDISGAQFAMQGMNALWSMGQTGTGVSEAAVMGLGQAPERETVRGTLTRQELAAKRLMMEAQQGEVDWVQPLADGFIKLDQQFLDLPHEERTIGARAYQDPVTDKTVVPTKVTIQPGDLQRPFRAVAMGSTMSLGIGPQQQNMMQLTTVLGNIPEARQALNWLGWVRLLARKFQMGAETNELLNTHPITGQLNQILLEQGPQAAMQFLAQLQMQSGQGGTGMAPQAPPGVASPAAPPGEPGLGQLTPLPALGQMQPQGVSHGL